MSEEITKKWVQAATTLATDEKALVPCPVCGKANLVVSDVRVDDVIARTMRCPACGAANDLRLVRPR